MRPANRFLDNAVELNWYLFIIKIFMRRKRGITIRIIASARAVLIVIVKLRGFAQDAQVEGLRWVM